jgi:hypothetical protein
VLTCVEDTCVQNLKVQQPQITDPDNTCKTALSVAKFSFAAGFIITYIINVYFAFAIWSFYRTVSKENSRQDPINLEEGKFTGSN